MSYPELINWDPMAEDYKKNFNINDDENPKCLYVRNVPANFTEEEFFSLMKDGGRTVRSVKLNKKHITTDHTYGFVYFNTHEDALLTRNELNGTPPLYLQICFAKMKKDVDRDKNEYQKNISKGRGIRIDIDGHKSVDKNEYRKNISKGRGIRIDIDGHKSSPQKLKVTTGNGGRRVSVVSPEKKNDESSGLKSPCQTVDQKSHILKSNVSPALVFNPYCNCFCCGKKAEFACATCMKPYCSESCQSSDWITHKRHCKQIKETADLLIKAYKSDTEALDSSYLSESSNSDFEKSQEFSDIKKLLIPLDTFEKVSVTNINSPSKFWVHLEKFSGGFSKVERELSSLQKHSSLKSISCRDNLLCCAVYKNKIYRGRILNEKSRNEATVYLLDYGETVTTQKSALFSLPEELRKLPAQAVCCKLVDETMKEDIEWNSEDILSFQLHATNKTYKAHILRCANDIYEVSLINQDGISVFSILAEAKKTVPCISESLVSANDEVPPSVWSKLKPKIQVKLVPLVDDENGIWCYLLTNEDLDMADIVETEELLKNYSGKDISLCVEEGDFAAGFSDEFKQFYRCVVLKRKCSSFSVRYIDYGNEEEITHVSSLSEKLIKKCSYIVKCVKPTSMSLKQLKEVLSNSRFQITVKKVSTDIAELAFNFQGEHIMYCHPCYPCNLDSGSNETEVIEHKKDLKHCKQTNLLLNHTYNVKIVFLKSASEVYVQLMEDENKINKLFTDLNSYYNSSKSTRHMPVIGDIVGCKFSDEVWYRALVKEKRGDTYCVTFIDYGDEHEVHPNNIQVLPEKFNCPKFAVCVSLSEIKNEDLSKCPSSKLFDEIWNMRVISETNVPEVILSQKGCLLKQMIESKNNKKSKAALKFKKIPIGITIDVKFSFEDEQFVYLHQAEDIKALEQLRIKLNSLSKVSVSGMPAVGDVFCGLFSDGLWYRICIEKKISSDIYKVYFLDYGNYENLSINNLRELPSDLFALPVYCIPVIIQNREKLLPNAEEIYTIKTVSNNGDAFVAMILEDKKEDSLKAKTDKDNIDKISKKNLKFQKLPSDVNVDVKISCEDKFMYLHQTKDLKSLEELCIQLNSLSELPYPKKLVVGNVYCGLCSDNLWYRVSVEEEVSPDKYKVLFLDYGNCENVSRTNLRELPYDLLALPVYCIPVIVENRKDLNLSAEEQYAVRVTGMRDEAQTVEFLLHSKESSLACTIENQTKNKMNKADLTFQKLPVEQNISVKISFQDEKYIYLHQINDVNAIEELSIQLNSLSNLKTPKNPGKNDVYCGLFTDSLWYRVSIEEVLSPNMYKVFFLDYGNYENVSINNLRELPSDLFVLPVYCIPVTVKNKEEIPLSMEKIYVISVTNVVKDVQEVKFSLESKEDAKLPHISLLKKQQLKDGLNEVKIFWVDKDVYYCQLSSDDGDILTMFKNLQKCSKEKSPAEFSVGDVICAQSSDGCWYRASILSNRNPSSLKVFFLDYGNTEYVTSDCIKFLPNELLEQPTFAIPMKIENLQEIQNSDDLTKPLIVEKIKLLDGNLHAVKIYLEIESTAPEISKTGLLSSEDDKKICEIEPSNKMSSSVEKSEKFTFDLCKSVPFNSGEQDIVIYSVDEDGSVFCAPFIEENIKANIELSQTLTEHCNHHGISFNDGSEPELTEMVLALYPVDNQWYRGTIIDKLDGSYFVNFVDYGNTEQLDLSSLCKMEKQFMELDVQAHMCTLTGFSMTDENKQRVYEELKSFTIFSCPEPLRAVVEIRDNDITLSIPKITSSLIEKQLVTRS